MDNDLFHLFGKASKKAFFLYNLRSQQFDYLSEAVERIWEVDRLQVLEMPKQLAAAIHPDDLSAVTNRFEQIVEEGVGHEVEFSLMLPDNNRKEVKVDAYPIRNDAGSITHVAGEAEDITKQSQYIDYLREYTRRKDSTLEIIAHDLRGPLSIVQGVASLIQTEHLEQKYEKVNNYTELILNAYDNCVGLIDNLLSDEHLQSPSIYVKIVRFDIMAIVQKLLHSFQVAKGVQFTFELHCDEDKIMVELDEVKFTQILNNLVSNSIKFTKAGGTISLSLKREGSKILLKHSDNGIGIPQDMQPYVFDRHSKTSREGLYGEPSLGVGLSIVRELVEVQGGSIAFESKEGEGTTFFLRFPLPPDA